MAIMPANCLSVDSTPDDITKGLAMAVANMN
jgi:hypothetical protein